MTLTYSLLLAAAVLIILALAGYAWHLTRRVNEVQQQQQQEQAQAELKLRQRQLELLQDIRFIARAVLEEQCDITEGVLRIQYLMSALDPDAWQLDELVTLRQHHAATAGMPILDAYKALPKKDQFRLDQERWALEERHKEAVQRELRWLISYRFPAVTLLQ